MKGIELVIFDVGGTVIEDTGLVPRAFGEALRLHGYSATEAEIARWRGASKREVIRRIVGEEEGPEGDVAERVYRAFQEILVDLFREEGARPIEGVERAFARLHEAGVRMALTTGFDRRITEAVLGGLGRRDLIDAIVCSDDVSTGRPAPYMIFRAMEQVGVTSVHAVANVGDTTNDLRSGYAAGVAANIGVSSGAHGRERLLQVPHTHILDSAAQVPAALAADREP